MSRVLRFLDALIQRPGAYQSTWHVLKELGWLWSVVLATVWAFWTWVASGVVAIHAMGWGAWPILGLILTAATIGVVAGAVWLVRYVRGEGSDAPRPCAVAVAAAVSPDRWLLEAVFYIVHGRWLGEHEQALSQPGQLDQAADLLGEIRQLARNGELQIWGKIWENSTWDPIPADYWAHHDVDAIELMRERHEHMRTSSATPEGKEGPFYKSLRVSKAQFEQRWPVAAG